MAAARAIDEQLSRLVIPDVDGVRRPHIAFNSVFRREDLVHGVSISFKLTNFNFVTLIYTILPDLTE